MPEAAYRDTQGSRINRKGIVMESTEKANEGWPLRPWLMAVVGAIAGILFWLLVDMPGAIDPPPIRQAAAAFVMVAAVSFLITAERRRMSWAAAFAIVWGAIIGMIGFYTATYNFRGEIVEFPFLSALLAVGIAGPLFQVIRDEGRPEMPYAPLHRYVWDDAIIGAASLAFTGLTFLLAFLLAQLFDAIGIDLIKDLLDEGWFDWMLAGAAFGAASAILRERAPLLATLQRLVTAIISVLAPVFAVALILFLLALPATGFAGLWKSGVPETPLLLAVAAFAFVFLNAIIGASSDDRSKGRVWRLTEIGLLGSVLPLGVLALVSMSMRVDQYGWTPERLWGVIACVVAIAFGVANWVAFALERSRFDVRLRDYQKKLAVGVCGLALLLAMPILDFGKISTRSQLAKLESGKIAADKFDWAALKYDFGPAGRSALERYAKSGTGDAKKLAMQTLQLENRYEIDRAVDVEHRADTLESHIEVANPDIVLTERLRRNIASMRNCGENARCKLFRLDEHRLILLVAAGVPQTLDRVILDERETKGVIEKTYPQTDAENLDLAKVDIEIRDVPTKQVFVNGQAVGAPFE